MAIYRQGWMPGPLALTVMFNRQETACMTAHSSDNANPPTPWEFLPDDEQRPAPEVSAEEAALHVERPGDPAPNQADDEPVTVHYLDDEDAEVADVSAPTQPAETTADTAALLTRQHYLPPSSDEAEDSHDS